MKKMKNNLLTEKLAYNGDRSTPTHLHLLSYDTSGVNEFEGETFSELKAQLVDGRLHWIQIHGLRDTETVQQVCAYFCVDFLLMQDILNTEHSSKIEEYERYNFVVTRFLREKGPLQVCFVQGTNFVLTFLEEETSFFDDVQQAISKNILKIRSRQSDYLLTVLLNSLAMSYIAGIAAINDELDDLESELLTATSARDIGQQIQNLRRKYLELKRTVVPLKEQYAKLLRSDSSLIHKTNRAFFNDVNDHLINAAQSIDICRETLASLMDLYISNNDLRMNDIMKRLTIVSTIFIPMTFLAGVWGMNFRNMPELNSEYGYWIAWGIMLLSGVIAYLFFRTKKWR